jgi:hypothetical protein
MEKQLIRFQMSACAAMGIARWYYMTQCYGVARPVTLQQQVDLWHAYAEKAALLN